MATNSDKKQNQKRGGSFVDGTDLLSIVYVSPRNSGEVSIDSGMMTRKQDDGRRREGQNKETRAMYADRIKVIPLSMSSFQWTTMHSYFR